MMTFGEDLLIRAIVVGLAVATFYVYRDLLDWNEGAAAVFATVNWLYRPDVGTAA